jgi:hypothetical protein
VHGSHIARFWSPSCAVVIGQLKLASADIPADWSSLSYIDVLPGGMRTGGGCLLPA